MDPGEVRAVEAARLKAFATGLLVAMALLFFLSTWAMGAIDPRFVWVQAFSEAALVGGLADWFAVTALFRHPLGIPIPHTAIIPENKDRIGDALAQFLKENFLTPQIVARRLDRFDAAAMLAGFLERPASGGRIRRGVARLLGQLWDTPAAAKVTGQLKAGAMRRLRDTEVAPLLGQMLEAMVENGRHRPVIDGLIGWAARTLDSQEGLIRDMVEQRTAWLLRLVNVDERVADELVGGIRGLLQDMADDPAHPVRVRADAAIADLVFDLKHMPETQAKVERMKFELLDNPAVGNWVEGLWARATDGMRRMLEGEGAGDIAGEIGGALRNDPALAAAINQLARRAVVGTVADHGDSIVTLVSDTVKGWDAATVTDKLESAVSRDLQYIRLNGTVIGGSIGVALHAMLVLSGAA